MSNKNGYPKIVIIDPPEGNIWIDENPEQKIEWLSIDDLAERWPISDKQLKDLKKCQPK